MDVIEEALRWAVATADDDTHGYSRSTRWGPSYDCSSFVITAYQKAMEKAGLKGPRDRGATYTGNMEAAFLACGFEKADGCEPERGDVLLSDPYGPDAHAALYLGGGIIVHARSAENTSDTADGSGNEIRVQSMYADPERILRYAGKENRTEGREDRNTATDEFHIVKAGESLFAIAAAAFGDGRRYREIMELNGLDSTVIRPGQKLRLRPAAEEEPEHAEPGFQETLLAALETMSGLLAEILEAMR